MRTNRLVACVQMTIEERCRLAAVLGRKLSLARGPSVFLLPLLGIEEWDRPGQAMHDTEGLAAFSAALRRSIIPPTELVELACHINDAAFVDAALAIFDRWVIDGKVPPGSSRSRGD